MQERSRSVPGSVGGYPNGMHAATASGGIGVNDGLSNVNTHMAHVYQKSLDRHAQGQQQPVQQPVQQQQHLFGAVQYQHVGLPPSYEDEDHFLMMLYIKLIKNLDKMLIPSQIRTFVQQQQQQQQPSSSILPIYISNEEPKPVDRSPIPPNPIPGDVSIPDSTQQTNATNPINEPIIEFIHATSSSVVNPNGNGAQNELLVYTSSEPPMEIVNVVSVPVPVPVPVVVAPLVPDFGADDGDGEVGVVESGVADSRVIEGFDAGVVGVGANVEVENAFERFDGVMENEGRQEIEFVLENKDGGEVELSVGNGDVVEENVQVKVNSGEPVVEEKVSDGNLESVGGAGSFVNETVALVEMEAVEQLKTDNVVWNSQQDVERIAEESIVELLSANETTLIKDSDITEPVSTNEIVSETTNVELDNPASAVQENVVDYSNTNANVINPTTLTSTIATSESTPLETTTTPTKLPWLSTDYNTPLHHQMSVKSVMSTTSLMPTESDYEPLHEDSPFETMETHQQSQNPKKEIITTSLMTTLNDTTTTNKSATIQTRNKRTSSRISSLILSPDSPPLPTEELYVAPEDSIVPKMVPTPPPLIKRGVTVPGNLYFEFVEDEDEDGGDGQSAREDGGDVTRGKTVQGTDRHFEYASDEEGEDEVRDDVVKRGKTVQGTDRHFEYASDVEEEQMRQKEVGSSGNGEGLQRGKTVQGTDRNFEYASDEEDENGNGKADLNGGQAQGTMNSADRFYEYAFGDDDDDDDVGSAGNIGNENDDIDTDNISQIAIVGKPFVLDDAVVRDLMNVSTTTITDTAATVMFTPTKIVTGNLLNEGQSLQNSSGGGRTALAPALAQRQHQQPQ
ncbi:hypothetical protein HDU76_007894, partial [Blyttiomyces sp. JEL0837]